MIIENYFRSRLDRPSILTPEASRKLKSAVVVAELPIHSEARRMKLEIAHDILPGIRRAMLVASAT
jgi:hypothetical protein